MRDREVAFRKVGEAFESIVGFSHDDIRVRIVPIYYPERRPLRFEIRIIYRGKKEFIYPNDRGRGDWGESTAKFWGKQILIWLRDDEIREAWLKPKKK